MTRGIKHAVERFVNDMCAQYFKYTDIRKGKKKKWFVQLAMRPIQLWEVVFPEDALQEVMATMFTNEFKRYHGFKHKMLATGLRKMLGAKKVPKRDKKALHRPVFLKGVEVLPIGIKTDVKNPDGAETL